MNIGIVGTGKMARGFARALAPKHRITFGSRDPERALQAATETGAAGGGSYEEAVAGADVVILAVPWTAALETVRSLPDLGGKVVLDITNPYVDGKLQPLEGTSTAEEIQKVSGAAVVKSFNHIYAQNLAEPEAEGMAASVFVAGDDEAAKAAVSELARDMGFDPVDIGGTEKARALERFVKLLGSLGFKPDRALRVLKR